MVRSGEQIPQGKSAPRILEGSHSNLDPQNGESCRQDSSAKPDTPTKSGWQDR